MSIPDEHDGNRTAARSDRTAVDKVSPFDATRPLESPDPRETRLSDPPTVMVRASGFVELPHGSVVGETYEIDAKIGAGAMGEVYSARHIGLGKRVAIKVIGRRLSEDSAAIERFAMEARTLAQIQHPAIVAVDHVGELADGRAYFVMEFLRGESLFDRLQRGRLPLPEALRVLDQMARGLDAAHGQGVTHRDLKPENTFLVQLPGEPPLVKLVDYGLAKLRPVDDLRAERTQSGVAIGTPMYMSPEQARGPDVDYRTDVYALGCVAYELLLGTPPFPHARTAPELYAAHLHEDPPLPRSIWPAIPPPLDLVLFAMLAKDPAHRPTLDQVRAVIATVRMDDPSRAATEFVGPRAAKPRSKNLLIAAIAIGALVGGIAIGASLTARSGAESREAPVEILPTATAPAPAVATSTRPSPAPPTTAPPTTPPPTTLSPPLPPKQQTAPITPRSAGSGARVSSASQPAIKAGSAATIPAIAPAETGSGAQDQRQPTAPPTASAPATINRNQTVNPFKKSTKVSP
jgi:serine/threonine-protein kinase